MSAGISWLDIKLGLRMLLKYPALTLVGGLGLAISIAISVGFFAFLSANVYPTLPLEEGERIVAIENRDATTIVGEERRSLHDFVTWREELRSVEHVGAFRTVERTLIAGEGSPEPARVAEMTAAGFRLARTPPLMGRYLVPEDEREGAPHVVVIGHDVWQGRFAGDPGIVGREIRLGRTPHTVVGVMPTGFAFPMSHEFWTPLRADPSAFERREGPAIFIFGRLAAGYTMEEAQAELDAIGDRTAAAFPETHARLRPMVMPYTHSLTDIQGTTTWMVVQMQLMMSLLLLVVALNVAVLVYARTAARQGEIAVRTALGASRGRVVAQLFAEALVLALGAAIVGLTLAQVGVGLGNQILQQEMTGTPFWMDYSLRPATVLFTVLVAVVAAVIVGVLPALQATGPRLQSDLRQLGGGTGLRLGRTWTLLIVAQVAIAVAALPAAVNLGWSEIRTATTRPIYPAQEFLVAGIGEEEPVMGTAGSDAPGEAGDFGVRLTELIRRLEAEPEVAGVTFRASLPDRSGPLEVEGVPAPVESPAGHGVSSVGAGIGMLEVFGARLLAGRGFEPGDLGHGSGAVLVNRAFVRQVLGGGEALGRSVRYSEVAGEVADARAQRSAGDPAVSQRWFQIVGVVEDLRTNPMDPELIEPQLFYPVAAEQIQQATLAVRLRGSEPAAFGPRLRAITASVDPSLRLGRVRSLADSDRQDELAVRLVGLVIGLVLLSVFLLSAAGVYALTSFTVTRRRKEIGIRSALGAHPRQVLWSVFSRAARQVGVGLAVGISAAALLDGLAGGELMGGRAGILLPTFGGIMALVALLAALGPARRGLRIEPTEALRADT